MVTTFNFSALFIFHTVHVCGGLNSLIMIREILNNQDSCGDPLSLSDRDNNISPLISVDLRTKIDQVKHKSWLRLGIGPDEHHNTTSYKLQHCNNNGGRRDGSLDLSLATSASTSVDAQLLPLSDASLVYKHQLLRPQTLLHRSPFSLSSTTTSYSSSTATFCPLTLGNISEVTNNNVVTKSCVGGPSLDFRVLDPRKRPKFGLWFLLQASQHQEREPFLPQLNKSYLRIKDGRITVKLVIKYLMKKLQVDSESQIVIRCKGQRLSPLLTMQHVRDTIWTPKSSSCPSVMILHYGRSA